MPQADAEPAFGDVPKVPAHKERPQVPAPKGNVQKTANMSTVTAIDTFLPPISEVLDGTYSHQGLQLLNICGSTAAYQLDRYVD